MKSKAIFNLAYINGQYPKEGEMKNAYHYVGSAFLRDKDDKEIFSIKLESYPPIGKNVYAFEKVKEGEQAILNTSQKKSFNVCVPNGKYADGDSTKTSYHKVGVAYLGERGLNLRFYSLPFINQNSECWLNLFENIKGENSTDPTELPTIEPTDAFDASISDDTMPNDL